QTYAPAAINALAPDESSIPALLARHEDPWLTQRYGQDSLAKKLKVIGLSMELPTVPPPPTFSHRESFVRGEGIAEREMTAKEKLEKRRSSLSATEQALLEKRKQSITSADVQLDIIPRRPQDAPAPASFAQQRFWFIHQLKPGNTAYNEIRTVRVKAQPDVHIFKRVLLEILRRHDILRCNFAFMDGQLQQIVRPYEEAASELSLLELDLEQTPADEREQEAQRYIQETVQRPFDLAKGLLWRPILIR